MRIHISHRTRYAYRQPVRSILQHLRLTPRDTEGQHVVQWRIEPAIDGRLRAGEDGFGNVLHVFSAEGPVDEVTIQVTGEVETTDTAGLIRPATECVPGPLFLRDTDLTRADAAIESFARDTVAPAGVDTLDALHRLLAGVHGAVAFDIRPTDVGTTAIEAFAMGRGVCQDLTHVFLSAARHAGIPARYVSGYFLRNDGIVAQDAGHAWAEAMVPGLGWVGFDPANGICTTEAHVRVAVALDYLGAAPIRGSRRGGGEETLDVHLTVDTARRQTQA